jgi:hypothetical protein
MGDGMLTYLFFRFPDAISPSLRQVPNWCWGEGQWWLIWLLCAGNRTMGVGVVILVSGADLCNLQRPLIELDGGLIYRQMWVFFTMSWNFIHWTFWDMNLEKAFITQGPNRNISRSTKRGPAEMVPKDPSSICYFRRTMNWLACCFKGLAGSLKASRGWLSGCKGMQKKEQYWASEVFQPVENSNWEQLHRGEWLLH